MTTGRNMDNFGTDDMALPEVKLIQNVGGDYAKELGAMPGDFYFTLTDDIVKGEIGFDVIVVDMQKTRTYWGRDDMGEDPPDCASLDANSMLSMDGKDCTECPHRCDTPWLLSASERRSKCIMNYNVLTINTENLMPLLIRTSGISSKAVKELNTQLRMNKALKGDYHRALVQVNSIKKKTAAGDAYAMRFRVKELISDALKAAELKAQSEQLLGTQLGLPEGREPEAYTVEGEPVYEKQVEPKEPKQSIKVETPEYEPIDLTF